MRLHPSDEAGLGPPDAIVIGGASAVVIDLLRRTAVRERLCKRLSALRNWANSPAGADRFKPSTCGDTLFLSAEDGPADILRPRLDALGADVTRVHQMRAVRDQEGERHVSLARDLPALERAIEQTQAIVVGIDPLSAYLGDTESYKDSKVRRLLVPLAALAERTGVAVVAIMHLTKDQQRRAIHRALGSVAFVAAARVVLAAAKDPEDDGRRLLLSVKNNLSAPAAGLAFRLDGWGLIWEPGSVEGVDADAVLSAGAGGSERTERADADEFLRAALAGGPVGSKELLRDAEANGISRRTLFRAKSDLGVRARLEGFGRAGRWSWSLPETLGLGLALERRAGEYYANAAVPCGVITSARQLSTVAITRLKDAVAAQHTGRGKRHGTLVLEDGMKFEPLAVSHEDSQFIESRRFSTEEIARLFGVPPHMIGADIKGSMTYSNSELESLRLLKHSLGPWLARISAAVNHALVSPLERRQLYAEYLPDALLATDTAGRYAAYKTALEAGFLTVEEVRRKENLPALTGPTLA